MEDGEAALLAVSTAAPATGVFAATLATTSGWVAESEEIAVMALPCSSE
jgi:hypothetical protein